MFMMNYNLMYLMILVVFSILSLNISSLFFIWTLMELNLLMVIPLLVMKSSFIKEQSSLSLKYFIIQVTGSIFLLMSLTILDLSYMSLSKMNFIFLMALMIKSGIPPFHFWFPQVMHGSNSFQAFIFLCIQKIIPIFLMSLLITEMIIIFISLGSILGGVMGMNQNSIMKILAYSSMVHSSWMISSMVFSINASYFYFLVYSTVSVLILVVFGQLNIKYLSEMAKIKISIVTLMFFIISILTLSGTPPFIGFFSKIFIIKSIMNSSLYFLNLILILGSVLSFFYYLRMITSLTLFNSSYFKEKMNFLPPKSLITILLLINFMFLLILWAIC